MHYRLLFPSQYLGAHDLMGKDAVVTIDRVVVEELKTASGTERKPVVHFVKKEKRLVLNKTNGTTIAAMYGNEVNGWTGKRITLYATTVSAFGKETEALRVRPTPPAAATKEDS